MTSVAGPTDWSGLRQRLGSRLMEVEGPLAPCLADPEGPACVEQLARLSNPFAIEDDPGAFHTTGWFNAFESNHSPRTVVAESAEDISTAVRFCTERGAPIVVKGTGHDYLGRSSRPE